MKNTQDFRKLQNEIEMAKDRLFELQEKLDEWSMEASIEQDKRYM